MALLIYDNGSLVREPSKAKFSRHVEALTQTRPGRGVELSSQYGSREEQPATPVTAQPRNGQPTWKYLQQAKTKADTLDDRRRLTVAHVMSSPVITCHSYDTASTAWQKMSAEEIEHLVVVDSEQNPLGIITASDILRHGSDSTTFVDNLISGPLLAVTPETLVREVALVFMEHKVNSVPVMDEQHQAVGIVCRSDLLRLLVSGPNMEFKV